jgi:hypothetical protein
MHYDGIVAVIALTAVSLSAFPLGSPRPVTLDAIASSVDDLVKRDLSLAVIADKKQNARRTPAEPNPIPASLDQFNGTITDNAGEGETASFYWRFWPFFFRAESPAESSSSAPTEDS